MLTLWKDQSGRGSMCLGISHLAIFKSHKRVHLCPRNPAINRDQVKSRDIESCRQEHLYQLCCVSAITFWDCPLCQTLLRTFIYLVYSTSLKCYVAGSIINLILWIKERQLKNWVIRVTFIRSGQARICSH